MNYLSTISKLPSVSRVNETPKMYRAVWEHYERFISLCCNPTLDRLAKIETSFFVNQEKRYELLNKNIRHSKLFGPDSGGKTCVLYTQDNGHSQMKRFEITNELSCHI